MGLSRGALGSLSRVERHANHVCLDQPWVSLCPLSRALETGDIAIVRAAAAELAHVGLGDAPGIVWAFREDDQPRNARRCVEWVASG